MKLEYRSNIELTNDTIHLALAGELWINCDHNDVDSVYLVWSCIGCLAWPHAMNRLFADGAICYRQNTTENLEKAFFRQMQPTRTITLESLITKQLPFQMAMLVKRNMAPYWLTIWRQPIQRHFRALLWTKMDSDRFIEAIHSPRLSLENLGHKFYVSLNGVYLSWDIYSCVSEITLVKLMDGWVCFCQTPAVLLFPSGKGPTTKSFNAYLCTKCDTKIVSPTKNDLAA